MVMECGTGRGGVPCRICRLSDGDQRTLAGVLSWNPGRGGRPGLMGLASAPAGDQSAGAGSIGSDGEGLLRAVLGIMIIRDSQLDRIGAGLSVLVRGVLILGAIPVVEDPAPLLDGVGTIGIRAGIMELAVHARTRDHPDLSGWRLIGRIADGYLMLDRVTGDVIVVCDS